MKTTKYIVVRTERVGYHRYPLAPSQVQYLNNLHRHKFYFEVVIEVYHNDRELEFLIVQEFINKSLDRIFQDSPDSSSCEMLGERLLKAIKEQYCIDSDRNVKVSVFEDNENGAAIISRR